MTKEKSPRTVEALQQKGKLNFTFLCRFPCKPQKMTHLLHFSIIDSQRILRRRELNYTVCTTPLWGAHREMVRGGERREWSIAGVKQTALWLRPEAWCHPETHARVLKKCREGEREREGPASDHFTGISRMFGHSSVLHKHRWTEILRCHHVKVDLKRWPRQNIWTSVCRSPSLSMYINRPLFTSETNSGACLSVSVHDYVWLCVSMYILMKWDFALYVLPTHVWACVCVRLFVCLCVCMMEEEKKVACGKPVPLRAAAVWTCAAAKENCGRKSLLIEHEACHLKLESSETQKPQQAGISVVLD